MHNPLTALTRAALPALTVLTLAACDSGEPLTGAFAELGIDTMSIEPAEGGTYVTVVEEGTGEPAADGDLIMVLYSGWLADGTLFDSSFNSEPPRPFPLVAGQEGGAIPGFVEGTRGMVEGEKRHIVMPPDQAYGEQGTPGGPIPPNATLIFEVEAQEIRKPTDPADVEFALELNVDLSAMNESETGLYWTTLEEGSGEAAGEGDTLEIHYTGWLADGTKFDSSYDREPEATPLNMVLGQTSLIAGWIEGVTGMQEGEKRRLVIPSDLAYGWPGRQGAIPGDATLIFEVELVELTKAEG